MGLLSFSLRNQFKLSRVADQVPRAHHAKLLKQLDHVFWEFALYPEKYIEQISQKDIFATQFYAPIETNLSMQTWAGMVSDYFIYCAKHEQQKLTEVFGYTLEKECPDNEFHFQIEQLYQHDASYYGLFESLKSWQVLQKNAAKMNMGARVCYIPQYLEDGNEDTPGSILDINAPLLFSVIVYSKTKEPVKTLLHKYKRGEPSVTSPAAEPANA